MPKANFEGNIIMISVIFHANHHSLSGNKKFIRITDLTCVAQTGVMVISAGSKFCQRQILRAI